MEIKKKVTLDLMALDGNAYSLMGAFKIQAKREHWTQEEIDFVINDCKSGNYDHLLNTLSNYCEDGVDCDYDDDENDCMDCLEEDCGMCK